LKNKFKTICIYCGSSLGVDPDHQRYALNLAQLFLKYNLSLIYGGSKIGLMGIIADEILKFNGNVFGVLPKSMDKKNITHKKLTKLFIVENMHKRKEMMFKKADGFIILPGGIGTLEEFFETLSWAQLKIHKKPIGVLNINGFYNLLLKSLQFQMKKGFINKNYNELLIVSKNPKDLVEKILSSC